MHGKGKVAGRRCINVTGGRQGEQWKVSAQGEPSFGLEATCGWRAAEKHWEQRDIPFSKSRTLRNWGFRNCEGSKSGAPGFFWILSWDTMFVGGNLPPVSHIEIITSSLTKGGRKRER